ncbi:MAG: transporter substrate-binding domain-containing protein [Actinomycetota bacterium]
MRLGKRFFLLFVSLLALLLIAAACGEEEPTGTGSDGSADEESSEGEPEFTLVEEGVLTVGSDIPYPPFEFEEAGELTGFDVEIVREIADRLGLENPDEAWISTDFGTIFQQLASGSQFDIVAAAVTGYAPDGSPAAETVAERTAVVDFTIPFYPSLQSLTVDSEANPDIDGVDALPEGARVGVQRATTGAFYAEEELTGAELVSFEKAPQMYQQLQAGQLDGVFNDLPVTIESISDKPTLEVVEQVPTGEEYAIAVSKDNPELTEAINGTLEEMFADGTFAEIYSTYFPEQELPEYASE